MPKEQKMLCLKEAILLKPFIDIRKGNLAMAILPKWITFHL